MAEIFWHHSHMHIDLTAKNRIVTRAPQMALTILVTLGQCLSVSAASELTASQLTALVRDPSLHISAKSATVVGTGPSVTVLAEEEAKVGDQNLKIDAMFLSKTLIEAAPGQISTVKIVFSQSGSEGRYISIENKEIQDFGSGKLTPEKLMASLRFTSVESERAPDVMPGPQYERRLLVWRRLEKLRAQGTGVGPYENIFRQIEALAKANDSHVAEKVDYLEAKLSEQEEQIKQARSSAMGRGVPQSSMAHQSAASEPGNTVDGMPSILFVPPDADKVKRAYLQQSQSLISQIDSKDHFSAEKLRALRSEIDKRFSAGQDGAAFALISQFGILVHTKLGHNPFAPGGYQAQTSNAGQSQKLWGQQQETGPGGGPGGGPSGPQLPPP
jgi:hypothetical protein